MNITKLGHCCLLIKVNDVNILTDPGAFSRSQDKIKGINIVLITHEHGDHLHVESLKKVLKNNPKAKVYTNSAVGKILDSENITYSALEGRDKAEVSGIEIEAFDAKHEVIYQEIGQVQNTGYFIAKKLFYPGDAFCNPGKSVDVLALPVAGPWCRIKDSINYALEVKPAKAFPVHDGMLQSDKFGSAHGAPKKVLAENGIEFVIMNAGDVQEF